MEVAPSREGEDHGSKVVGPIRGFVVEPCGLTALHSFEKAEAFEPAKSLGQDVGRNAFGRSFELGEATFPVEEVAHDEQRPLVAEEIEARRDRTFGTPGSGATVTHPMPG